MITQSGVVLMERKRGLNTCETTNAFLQRVGLQWETTGNNPSDLVVIMNIAPCHKKAEAAFIDSVILIFRLGPYSPMLNGIENIWGKLKSYLKANIRR